MLHVNSDQKTSQPISVSKRFFNTLFCRPEKPTPTTPPPTQKCVLCKMDRKVSDFPRYPLTFCKHEAACQFCMERHIHIASSWTICPVPGCSIIIPGSYLRQFRVYCRPQPPCFLIRNALQKTKTPRQFECKVCLEVMPFTAFPDYRVSSLCPHAPSVCRDCVGVCISTAIENGEEPLCPECPAVLCASDVEQCVKDKKILSKYEKKQSDVRLTKIENFRWCQMLGCGHGQIHEPGVEDPMVVCKKCSGKSCYTHQVAWHEGSTCEEFEKGEEYNKLVLDRVSMICPNRSCGARIERFGGCSEMKCSKCSKRFLWTLN